jgi:hypothetical protein
LKNVGPFRVPACMYGACPTTDTNVLYLNLEVEETLGSPYLPLHACDADLLARLLIIVEPLAVTQVDRGKFGGCVEAFSCEFALFAVRPILSL